MNTHTKFSRQRILAIVVTTLFLTPTQAHTANNGQSIPSKKKQTRAISVPSSTDIATTINSHTSQTSGAILTAIIPQLNIIQTAVDAIDTQAINAAVASLEASATSINESATELTGLVDNLATSAQAEEIIANQTTQGLVPLATAANLANLGTAIDALPTNTELGNAIDAQTLALQGATTSNTLTALAGATFNSSTDSLAAISAAIAEINPSDISTLATLANQTTQGLVPLATAANLATVNTAVVTNIPATLSNIAGSEFNTTTDSLAAISDAIANLNPSDISTLATLANQTTQGLVPLATAANLALVATTTQLNSAVAPLATSAGLTSAVSPLATTAQLNAAVSTLEGDITSATSPLATSAGLTSAVAPLATAANLATLQTTANTINTNVNTANSALTAIEGTSFAGGTDSLHNISNNTISVPFATAAALSSFQSEVNATLASIQNSLVALIAKNLGDPVKQVISAKNSTFLTTPVTSTDTNATAITLLIDYNTARSAALASCTIAATASAQSYTATTNALALVNTAIAAFDALATQWAIEGTPEARPSSLYSAGQISSALVLLNESLQYLQSNQAE